MAATAGYQAGIETSDVVLAYAQEANYGALPNTAFQALRLTGESLAGTKQRTRPGEILTTGEVSAAVTQQESAGGNVNFALSYGTYDDLLAGAFGADWVAGAPKIGAASAGAMSIKNGKVFKSFHFQKQLGNALFLRYPGSFVSGFTLSGGVGQFLSGNFTLMSAAENTATANASTGAVKAPPTGRVHDAVGGFGGVYLDGTLLPAVVDSFSITTSASGAKQEYGMGSATAQGQIVGLLEAKGQFKAYFRDFTLYQRFKSETQGVISFVTRDPAGNAYVVSLLAATIMNPNITAGGPSQAVMATFELEGNPVAGGGTIQIDRIPVPPPGP